ncbi:hypothetical protein A2U01_0084717 [Trifolium medium]|uniref:Uncharacterized protein n=1 Tax=Trifolium medium TaxID=97028 RepID=A0A392TT88_9FABA|nr:hypothetical protein [Trifolium medium]
MNLCDAQMAENSWCSILADWRDAPSSPARRAIDRASSNQSLA